MNTPTLENTLMEINISMKVIAPHRSTALFNDFLVEGYRAITLSSVSESKLPEILQAKVCLGTLITLYDDFADRPLQWDPVLLDSLYRLTFGESTFPVSGLSPGQRRVVDFAQNLFATIENVLKPLPRFRQFVEVLKFDLRQFYSANQYSSLLTVEPFLKNSLENRLYVHHNMGMVIAAMMDLMASDSILVSELGDMREVFLMGQRMGRIFNVLATRKREALDGDVTGELSCSSSAQELEIAERDLRQEICFLYGKIGAFENRIRTFSVSSYLEGLAQVQRLHEKMEGIL